MTPRFTAVRRRRPRRAPEGVRPTSAKVREAVFNILRDRIVGASFLELYAGTGLVGSDARDRGAARVVWVDRNTSFLEDRVRREHPDGVPDGFLIVRSDVHSFLRGKPQPFDLIFADPPYHTGELERLMESVSAHPPWGQTSLFILEHKRGFRPPEHLADKILRRTYTYGDTNLSLFSADPASPGTCTGHKGRHP